MATKENKLPEWLIADDGEDRDFVIHLHYPRFIVEMLEDGQGKVILEIDPMAEVINAELKAGREPAALLARLLRKAGEFFQREIEG